MDISFSKTVDQVKETVFCLWNFDHAGEFRLIFLEFGSS